MKLTLKLLAISLTVATLGTEQSASLAVDKKDPGDTRQGRLILPSLLFHGLFGQLGTGMAACPVPLFSVGCPGQVCTAGTNGANVCTSRLGVGSGCTTGFQCTSLLCRNGVCSRDDCAAVTQQSTCVAGQVCTATSQGNRCRTNTGSTQLPCAALQSTTGCPAGQYCVRGTTGNACTNQRETGATCTDSVQCVGTCRGSTCRRDMCPTLFSSQDCITSQYCASSPAGNACTEKLPTGETCTNSGQCTSNTCQNARCVQDTCPTLFSSERCPSTDQYCTTTANGNTCVMKLAAGVTCSSSGQCLSGVCESGRCMDNQCPFENMSVGCVIASQFCRSMPNGRQCVSKLANGMSCSLPDQCASGLCSDGDFCDECALVNSDSGCPSGQFCSDSGTGHTCVTKQATGVACATAAQCASGLCTAGFCDQCATPNAVVGCDAGSQFCFGATTGNTCVAKLVNTAVCVTNAQCVSGFCTTGFCGQCPMVNSVAFCANGQFCQAGATGNLCVDQFVMGAGPCVVNAQCVSGMCPPAGGMCM